jgi:tripartite-type tricarboxylate transporter receptor subunit TctC
MLVALIVWMILPGCGAALAQPFPYKPVKLIAAHAPGGQGDTVGRIIAPKLAELWGQAVVVENRVGAAGTIAAAFVAKSPPTGHVLLLSSSGTIALTAVIGKDLPYDPARDLTMIGRLASVPTVLAVGSWIPARNLSELVAYAKGRPGQLSAGSSGNGSTSGFALEMLKGAAGIDILQVPYGGLGPAVIGVLSGQIDMVFADFGLVNPYVKSGAMRLIASLGNQRLSAAPDLPTIREQGLDGVAVDNHVGITGPAGIPAETLAKLTSALNQVLRMPDVRQRLLELGFEPVEDTPALYAAAMREDIERFSIIARRMGADASK